MISQANFTKIKARVCDGLEKYKAEGSGFELGFVCGLRSAASICGSDAQYAEIAAMVDAVVNETVVEVADARL